MITARRTHKKFLDQYVWAGPEYRVQLDINNGVYEVRFLAAEVLPNMRFSKGGLSYRGPKLDRAWYYIKKRVPGAVYPKTLEVKCPYCEANVVLSEVPAVIRMAGFIYLRCPECKQILRREGNSQLTWRKRDQIMGGLL